MKFLITTIATVGAGLMMAMNDFSGLQELHTILSNRRRMVWSLSLAAIGFFLVMSAVVISVVEGSLQYEAQGFLLWSALFSAATGLAVVGAIFGIAAKLCLPKPKPPVFNWVALDEKFRLTETLEKWMRQSQEFTRDMAAESHPTPSPAHEAKKSADERREDVPPANFSATAFQDRQPNTPHH